MVQDTLKALEMSAVETIIVWENLTINRILIRNQTSGTIYNYIVNIYN